MKKQLQTYFKQYYPESEVNAPYSIRSKTHIRFELGGDLENGTQARIKQAVERATRIFKQAFKSEEKRLWILIYDFGDEFLDPGGKHKNHLFSLIAEERQKSLSESTEFIENGHFEPDEYGNSVATQVEIRLVIGKLNQVEIDTNRVFQGIANLEMGFEPTVTQKVYFFDPENGIGFHMYDDRGCYVFADKADKIRDLYDDLNAWIVDYHRKEIDACFS